MAKVWWLQPVLHPNPGPYLHYPKSGPTCAIPVFEPALTWARIIHVSAIDVGRTSREAAAQRVDERGLPGVPEARHDLGPLQVCLTCGHVGCCDSSPGRPATAGFRASGHPVIESFEPDEDWGWCYIHADFIELPEELRVAKR